MTNQTELGHMTGERKMTQSQQARTNLGPAARLGFAYPALLLLTAICMIGSTGCLSVRDRLDGIDLNPFNSNEDQDFEENSRASDEDEGIVLDELNFSKDKDIDPEDSDEAYTHKTDDLGGDFQLSESFLEQERRLAERERELERREREFEEAMAAHNASQTPAVEVEQESLALNPDLIAAPVRPLLSPIVDDPPELPSSSSEERLDFARSMVEAHDLALAGDFIASQSLYEKIVDEYPNRYEPYHHLAVIADCQKRYGQAIAWYVQAAELEPLNAEILHDLGRCLAQQGRFEDAEAALRRAVDAKPEEMLYRETLAINLAQREQYSNALDELIHVMSEADAYYKIAEILEQKNHDEGVKECLVLALESNPTHSPSLTWLQELSREEAERASATISPQSGWEPSYAQTSSRSVETIPARATEPLAIPAAPAAPSEEPRIERPESQPRSSAPAPLPSASASDSIAIPDFQIPEHREEVLETPSTPSAPLADALQDDALPGSGESAFGRSSLYHTHKVSTGVSGWRPRGAIAGETSAEESEPAQKPVRPAPLPPGETTAWNSDTDSREDESGMIFPLVSPNVSTALNESETTNVTLLDTPEVMR